MAQITLRDYLQETENAISSSRVDDALTHCQRMLSYFPEALEIQRLLGEVHLIQGRLEDARHIFDWVLTNDPENVIAYCNRADVSERMTEYDVALDCYQQAYELNRGNGHIREEFNRLSEKIGQRGFMLSRAGLARLYMRGDLLSQAIQEWDAVLATTSDRLDARTGLLETYWRAGLMEHVEQLAEQILRDVPGCLKALLLLASVISSKDSRRSQELLSRAEALDPDQIIAQELFADALVNHPDDPFLQQLKKAAILLPEAKAQGIQQNSFAPVSDPVNSLGSSSVMDALAQWGEDAYGDSETTLIKPRSATTSAPPENGATLQTAWNAPLQETKSAQSAQETHLGSKEHSLEPWELLQNALNQFDTIEASPTVTATPVAPYGQDLPMWENMSGSNGSPSVPKQQENSSFAGIGSDPWSVPTEEPIPPAAEPIPNPPSWLNMLAQTGSNLSALTPSNSGLPLADLSLEQLTQSNTIASESQNPGSFISPSQPLPLTMGASPMATEKAESQLPWLQSADGEKVEEDEESFFGPSWLKSLGATMAEEETPATTAFASETQTQRVAKPEYADPQYEELQNTPSVPETNPYEMWSQTSLNNAPNIHEQTPWAPAEPAVPVQNIQYEIGSSREDVYASGMMLPTSSLDLPTEQAVPFPTAQKDAEQNIMTTLEELEESLRSKGFLPLEPNALSTLAAQTQESSVSSHGLDTLKAPEAYDTQDFQQSALGQESQETMGAVSLSSALAQLGNFGQELPPPVAPSLASSLEIVEQNEEPSWLQALKNSSASATPAVLKRPTWSDTSIEPYTPAAPASGLIQPAVGELQQTVQTPTMYVNPLLENELETTMKRPAIRLQPMQHQSAPSQRQGQSHSIAHSQSGERIETVARLTKAPYENPSYQDRLVKGYQYQLVGNYDEAMQEYRLIIRSATDLLSEVISNLRALLKLAPNYTAGYRVLGDAYMRQGEYLQAMEVYNKALTMTKKVKTQA